MGYRLEDHTADLKATIEAASHEELYQMGADLVREILVGGSPVSAHDERELPSDTRDEPAAAFLNYLRELLYLYDSEAFIPVEAHGPGHVRGEVFDGSRHESHHQLKAVTRHGYKLSHDGEYLRAEVVFDI